METNEKRYERNMVGIPMQKWIRYARSRLREKMDVAIVLRFLANEALDSIFRTF